MGKLIFGIIVVVFLHFVFYMFVSTEWRAGLSARVTQQRSLDEGLPTRSVAGHPELVLPAAPTTTPSDDSSVPTKKHKVSSYAAAVTATSITNPRGTRRDVPELKPIAIPSRKTVESRYATVRTTNGRLIPPGYTMVLVDYLPSPARAEPRKTVGSRLEAREPATPRLETRDVSPKKRSYLARNFPGFIKKPWKWMKSIASKLD